jgi:tyrosinase
VGATPPEDRLDFWREDPLLNDHHDHWHDVYPFENTEPGGDPHNVGDRHGELFAYMHEQMLARYDAERLAVGLSRVQPFDDYLAEIPEGYDAGKPWSFDGRNWWSFRPRPAGAKISDQPETRGQEIREHASRRKGLFDAAESGKFDNDGREERVTADNLGNTVEPNINSIDRSRYGNYHGRGHVHLAFYDNQPGLPGVMNYTETAVRDPVFWRWHKHVDSIFRSWQEDQRQDLSDAPPVKIRKSVVDGAVASSDIILCLKNGLPAEFDGKNLGSEAFGYSDDPDRNNWDKDFASATVTLPGGETVTTTDELRTEMLQRTINFVGADGSPDPRPINYLSHEDFFYFIRVENLSDQAQSATVRIFLAPETEVEDRTSWIEMDRFLCRLDGSERAVIFRPADLSSVVRKPALKPEILTSGEPWPTNGQQNWCDCGWPYTLLLPRGTKEGMEFRLFVMFSSGDDLMLPEHHAEHCTSVSYCGLQNKEYPDKRDMGYPFNRPFASGIPASVANHDNMAWRTIKIRCRNL